MGCSSPPPSYNNTQIIRQENITLDINSENPSEDLSHAQSLINLITLVRNNIIYKYHQIIYKSGACVYKSPTIVNCIKSIFYKISSELGGQFEKIGAKIIEDPPYLRIFPEKEISQVTQDLLQEFLGFIIKLTYYQKFFKQIDKETAQLFYLIHEDKEISEENVKKINQGLYLFKDMIKLRYTVLKKYREEMSEFSHRNYGYCNRINIIGKKAYEKKITDIYEICMLEKENSTNNGEMFKNVQQAKSFMEKIISTEVNYDENGNNLNNGENNIFINTNNNNSISIG